MQHAILTSTPAFDFKAFLAASTIVQGARVPTRTVFVEGAYPDFVAAAPSEARPRYAASTKWLIDLHLAAARRWLACSPAREDQLEASLRSIADACATSHPDVSRDLLDTAAERAHGPDVDGHLDRLVRLFAAA